MQGNRARDTRPERTLRSALHRRGLRFRKHGRPLPDVRFEADIVFRRDRIAVAVDGCLWHGCPEHGLRPGRNGDYWREKIARNIARDKRNAAALRRAGWTLIRVWEHDDPDRAAARIERRIRARR